jgi:hypothetical protein
MARANALGLQRLVQNLDSFRAVVGTTIQPQGGRDVRLAGQALDHVRQNAKLLAHGG